jgi:ATP-binding cassette subfamily F protein uup
VATAILAFEGNGQAVRYPGNYAMYRRLKEQAERGAAGAGSRAGSTSVAVSASGSRSGPRSDGSAGPRSPAGAPSLARRSAKLGFKEQRELEGMEAAIQLAEARQGLAEAALADPVTYQRGGAAVAALRAELDEAAAAVERLYARWQELEAVRNPAP